MSTTALVRSNSSSNSLTASNPQSKSVSPRTSSAISLPRLGSSPQQTPPSAATTVQQKQPQQQPSPAVSTPGRWRHPRMEEIIRRQNRSNFDTSNVRIILLNLSFLALSVYVPKLFPNIWMRSLAPYPTYILLLIRIFLAVNMGLAVAPALRQKDACEDIPLTPAQRQLLGLPPMSRPATPQEKEQYITPPRYSRSATPRSSSSSLHAEVSGSPLSGRGTPFSPSGSPFGSAQPSQRAASGSPLTPNGGAERRRLSYNARSSPLSVSEFDAAGGSVSTPSKINHRASVGLNSKWLYEKGRASPGSVGVTGNGWGTGSVFS